MGQDKQSESSFSHLARKSIRGQVGFKTIKNRAVNTKDKILAIRML